MNPFKNRQLLVEHYFKVNGLWPKYSRHLVRQIARGIPYGADAEEISYFILAIEEQRKVGLKPPERFKRRPLYGLWKAHIWGTNTLSELGHNMVNASKPDGWLFQQMQGILKKREGTLITQEDIRHLANLATDGANNARAKANKLTGDWIVFYATPRTKLYLTLATHDMDDERIAHLARMGLCEFGLDSWE